MNPLRMDRAEAAQRVVLAFTEACSRRDLDAALALLDENVRFEESTPAPEGEMLQGKEKIRERLRLDFDLHPQTRLEIEEILGIGQRCLLRWRQNDLRGAAIFRVVQGRICERLSYTKS